MLVLFLLSHKASSPHFQTVPIKHCDFNTAALQWSNTSFYSFSWVNETFFHQKQKLNYFLSKRSYSASGQDGKQLMPLTWVTKKVVHYVTKMKWSVIRSELSLFVKKTLGDNFARK